MFGLGAAGGGGTHVTPIDTDKERAPPPPPTLVYFPQNDLDEHEFETDELWAAHMPNLVDRYSHISKPSDIRVEHLRALNFSVENDVDLAALLPVSSDGVDYLPPPVSADEARPSSTSSKPGLDPRTPILSNGRRAPDHEMYLRHYREIACDNEDVYRAINRKRPRPGHAPPPIARFRKFWSQLEYVSHYWDASLDNYYSLDPATIHEPPRFQRGLKRLSIAISVKEEPAPIPGLDRYKGRRISTGSKMPEHLRVDCVRAFFEPFTATFGCVQMPPRKIPQIELGIMRLPVTQTAIIWRQTQDKSQARQGITEGPLLGIQCRAETGFMKDKGIATLDAAREIAGLLLLAEQRDREGRQPRQPGEGKWYTTTPRWGGGRGGEFGDAEGNTEPATHSQSLGHKKAASRNVVKHKTEEDVWRELKPGPALWDPSHSYLAVGKDRAQACDHVFMVSALFHHICILKLTVHPTYMDFVLTGKGPREGAAPPEPDWFKPKIQRSRWFDLLDRGDRVEAFRGLWGVFGYLMRGGGQVAQSLGARQKSDSHQHHFTFRRKSATMTPGEEAPARSHSVA